MSVLFKEKVQNLVTLSIYIDGEIEEPCFRYWVNSAAALVFYLQCGTPLNQVNFILYTNSEKLGLLWLKRDSSKFILALFHAVVKTIPLTDYNPSGWMVSQAAVSLFQQ